MKSIIALFLISSIGKLAFAQNENYIPTISGTWEITIYKCNDRISNTVKQLQIEQYNENVAFVFGEGENEVRIYGKLRGHYLPLEGESRYGATKMTESYQGKLNKEVNEINGKVLDFNRATQTTLKCRIRLVKI